MLGTKKKEKEDTFYELFLESIEKILEAGVAFEELVRKYDAVGDRVANLKVLETECDMKTHKILKHLNENRNTPMDREDIYNIARELDDIVDCIEEVANRFVIFGIEIMRPEALTMAKLILQAIRELETLFQHLHEIKSNTIVMEQVIEVNRIENEGDVVYRGTLARLFQEEKDPIEIIKWKHIYEQLEESLDACENVANQIEGVIMKYS
ncbi:MAG: DUF47 domain-containing protein [Clostridia bacterium]|jgi:predicted phosphate transport protein (TIGR00153 family)|nr:DUF47 domain-containing protein [Clostridia bacterium]HPD90054.1 DUF47 family protein [Bacillota bacterium]